MATIIGTAGIDTINGTKSNDTIYGLDGNDTINAAQGNDLVIGDMSCPPIKGPENKLGSWT